MGLFSLLDLVSLNIDEAARMTSFDPHEYNPETIVNKVVDQLANRFPALSIALTAGKIGSWIWDGQRLDFKPSFPVQVVSTAGAGDAFLASLIAGTAKGLKLNHSHELGNLVAALSVTSPHTIAPEVSRETILTFANEHHFELSPAVQTFLKAA